MPLLWRQFILEFFFQTDFFFSITDTAISLFNIELLYLTRCFLSHFLASDPLVLAMATKKKGPEPLSAATIKNLHDKLYDKRKLGAVEVEVQVRELRASGQGHEKIVDILTYLNESFIASGSMSSRKGGLIAFAAAALGLGGVRGPFSDMPISKSLKLAFPRLFSLCATP